MTTLVTFLTASCASAFESGDQSGPVEADLAWEIAGRRKPCYEMNAEACETFHLTNRERRKHRLPALKFSSPSHDMAQEHSEDMAERDYFSHERPTFKDRARETFSNRVLRFGLQMGVGENIAMCASPTRALELWMKSPGHRKNILNPKFKSFAVGFKDGLYTQVFSVVDESR